VNRAKNEKFATSRVLEATKVPTSSTLVPTKTVGGSDILTATTGATQGSTNGTVYVDVVVVVVAVVVVVVAGATRITPPIQGCIVSVKVKFSATKKRTA
jgi:hypothetical protein